MFFDIYLTVLGHRQKVFSLLCSLLENIIFAVKAFFFQPTLNRFFNIV